MTLPYQRHRKRRHSRQQQAFRIQDYVPLDEEGNIVPKDPHQFYRLLGPIYHPKTRQPVERLAWYQYKGWQLQLLYDLLVIKSNKVGYSSTALDALIQNCLLKATAGYEKLVVCQTARLAKEHLYTIRKRLVDSEKLSQFLIMEPREYLLQDEVTRITELYIDNPYNPTDPSRIIGIGASAGSVVSWKRVNYGLMSDLTMAKVDYTPIMDGISTRLANTQGRLHIETIPGLIPQGRIYELYEAIKTGENKDFKLLEITADDAVKENVITQEFLDRQKILLGSKYGLYYGAKWIYGSGGIFLLRDVEACQAWEYSPEDFDPYNDVYIGCDPQTEFALTAIQVQDKMVNVLDSEAEPDLSVSEMVDKVDRWRVRFKPTKIFVDGSMKGFVKDLKGRFGESQDYRSIIDSAKKEKRDFGYDMFVVPVYNNDSGVELLDKGAYLVGRHLIKLHKRFRALSNDMLLATRKPNLQLDKTGKNSLDSLESFNYALKGVDLPTII